MVTAQMKNIAAARLLCESFRNRKTQTTREAMAKTQLFRQESMENTNKQKAISQLAKRKWEREQPNVPWMYPSQIDTSVAAEAAMVSDVPQPPARAEPVPSSGSNVSKRAKKLCRQSFFLVTTASCFALKGLFLCLR